MLLSTLLFLIFGSFVNSQFDDSCKCVPYYLCKNGTIVDDGDVAGLINERMGNCRCKCPQDEVCCRLKTDDSTTTPTEPTQSLVTCGLRNPDGVGYKSGTPDEDKMRFGEFPWIVDILVDNGAHRCGGSLIHPSVVLTAAHCVKRKKPYVVRAGDYDSSATDEVFQHQELHVGTVKIHEDYNPAVLYNDIALLFLNGAFNLSDHIQPVCLPPSNADVGTERCFVGGRGKDESGQYQPVLKKIEVPLVDRNSCQMKLRTTQELGRYYTVHRSFICAGGEKNKDSCTGDGGAPLFCPIKGEDDKYHQLGIVSYGLGCFRELPAVYTNVRYLKNWIDKQMKEKNLVTTYYTY